MPQADPNPQTLAKDRLNNAVLKNLSPHLQRAVEALWANFEALDLELITTPADAEEDFLAAIPAIDGVEDDIRQLVRELVEDIRMNFNTASDAPMRLRFAYQNKDELIEQILPRSRARLVVMPLDKNISLHANVKEK